MSPRSASSDTAALNLSEKFRLFVILVSIHSGWAHLSTLSEFAEPLHNDLFHPAASLQKVGVDPASGGTHRMTSDDLFATNKEVFDVIFIDGLHEYEQVHRDAINALNTVEVGGWIAFHDFLHSSWKEHHIPRINGQWTGDCWKLAVQLTTATGVEFTILDMDHGVGVMRIVSNEWHVPKVSHELKVAEFDKFLEILNT